MRREVITAQYKKVWTLVIKNQEWHGWYAHLVHIEQFKMFRYMVIHECKVYDMLIDYIEIILK